MTTEPEKIVAENARALGLDGNTPLRYRGSMTPEEKARRRAERAQRHDRASGRASTSPSLDTDAEVTDEDEAAAIASIMAKHDEEQALRSIMDMFK